MLVERLPADKEAPEIVDPLITSELIAVDRGTAFINKNYKDRRKISGSGPFKNWIPPGSKVLISDSEFPEYQATVKSISLDINIGSEISADISMEMEQII